MKDEPEANDGLLSHPSSFILHPSSFLYRGDTVVDQTLSQRASHFFVMQALGDHPIEDYCLADGDKCYKAPRKQFHENRPQQLLQLICKSVKADQGGVAYLSSAGELIENITSGLSDEEAGQLWAAHWVVDVVRLVADKTCPLRLDDLVATCSAPGSPKKWLACRRGQWQPRRFPCTRGP